ncbi:MAG: hypothetical protein AAGK04_02125 [Planctomycetota bacterium]
MMGTLFTLAENLSNVPGFFWIQKYIHQTRAVTTDIRDRKQRAEEIKARVDATGKAAKNVGGKGDKKAQGARGSSDQRLRTNRGSNSRRATGPRPPEPAPGPGPSRGAPPPPPARSSAAPRDTSASHHPASYDQAYPSPPRRERLRRRARPEDDE